MKSIIKTTVLFTLILIFTACNDNACVSGEGTIITQTLELDSFNKIDASSAVSIILTQGETQKVTVIGHQNIIDELKTSVSNNTLEIGLENGCYNDYELAFEITIPSIASIDISGACDVIINDFEGQTSLETSISGSGHIELNDFTGLTNLDIDISGSGYFEGNENINTLENVDISISGSGNYYGYSISSKNTTAKVSGSGTAKISAIDNLDVSISGSGKVYYIGNPVITQSVSGSGSLINAN